MKFPHTVWNYSKETEAIRILQAGYSIRDLFFVKKGFFVLPYLVKNNPKCVYFPKIPITKTAYFWSKVRSKSQELAESNDSIISTVANELDPLTLRFTHLQNEWAAIEKDFWKSLNMILPGFAKNVITLEIRPTAYGTIATGYSIWLQKKKKGHIIIYVRSDADVSHICEAILIDILYPVLYSQEYTWEEAEAISDFLLTQTRLNKALEGYKPTLLNLRKKTAGNYVKDSNMYLKKLGIEAIGLFKIVKNKIYIGKTPLDSSLTDIEEKILTYFIKHKNTIVPGDKIADIIWDTNSYDKFSQYAIAKHIQRIREKIELTGISSAALQTHKKRGYLLAD